MNKRVETYQRGLWGERLAGLYLWIKGYRIRARRYKTPVGEIDLVVTRGQMLVFVEVKARPHLNQAITAILPRSGPRLRRAAEHYLIRHPEFAAYDQRFDLVAVAPICRIHHLDNIDLGGA